MKTQPKRIALWCLLVSVALTAVIGIGALLLGNFGEVESRILMTTAIISVASLCGLACGALWERGEKKPLAATGAILAVVSAGLVIYLIWAGGEDDWFVKTTGSLGVLALTTAHVCLLSLPVTGRKWQWLRWVSHVLIYSLAGLIISLIFGLLKSDGQAELFFRVLGVNAILVGAVSLALPVLHWLNRDTNALPDVARAAVWPTITCPRCGTTNPFSEESALQCASCDCRFSVQILR